MKVHASAVVGAVLLGGAAAFPQFLQDEAVKRAEADSLDAILNKRVGPITKPGFNAKEQYVSTSGKYKFVAPGPTDQRGPCPGLNALANHGYMPHNGIGTIDQFIESTYVGFGMGRDLGGFLGVYGAIFDGDLTEWSIGFASPQLPVISGMLGTPQGIGGSHNNYENDASPMRGDLYTYGESYKTQLSNFEEFYNMQAGVPDDQVNFGLETIAKFRKARFDHSIATNPYFFNGPFSGVAASPAAYTFIYRFMANKSAEYPEGRLDRETLKTFYSVTGEPGSFQYKPGYERFPKNWYKRAIGDAYTIPFFATDAVAQDLMYPEFASIGGNLGKTNSFVGFDPANFTGGLYELSTLAEGNNAECFFFELAAQGGPSLLEGLFLNVTPGLSKLAAALNKYTNSLGCKKLAKMQYNQKFKQFPGYSAKYDGYDGAGRFALAHY